MSNQGVVPAGESVAKVYKCVLTPNREDRPRYAVLVSYEAGTDGRLHPLRREWAWVKTDRGWLWLCTRVTEVRWRSIAPQQAHVEMRDQWMAHVREAKARAKKVKAQEAGHVVELQEVGR